MPGGARSMKGEKQMIYKNITFKADPFSYNLELNKIAARWPAKAVA